MCNLPGNSIVILQLHFTSKNLLSEIKWHFFPKIRKSFNLLIHIHFRANVTRASERLNDFYQKS